MDPYQPPHAAVDRPDNVHFRVTPGRLLAYLAFGLIATLVSWSEHSSASPFHELLWDNLTLRNVFVLILLPAEFVGVIVEGNIHSPNENAVYVAAFVQGSLMAALFNWSYAVWRRRRNTRTRNEQ